MGIPSYFSYILKNHNVIKRLDHHKHKNNIDILLMDCNSIIYNIVYSLNTNNNSNLNINIIIEKVFKEIKKHIKFINPRHLCIIAFDGVAPLAKMKQQRDRRYKSAIFNSYKKSESRIVFDTSQITPGTDFMNQLTKTLKKSFDTHTNSFNCNVKFTGTTDEGEGEHKLFEFIREFKTYCQKKTIYIYGLDSDLIILSLEHLKYTSNIVLYRDTFKKNTDRQNKSIENDRLQSNMFDIMDMTDFSQSILREIKLENEQTPQQRITDYALLSFFLGNDFLPHSPILPIRTFGISELIRSYRNTVDNNIGYNYLTNKNKIIWSNIKSLCQFISLREKEYIKKEIYHLSNEHDIKQKHKKSEYIQDQKCRQSSIYLIEPDYNGWQKRYYEYMFLSEPTDEFIKNVCIKYLEGLQWCLYYYTDRCVDYKWVYPYYYPPLFSDLVKYIPEYSCELFDKRNIQNTITPLEQLTYVLPPTSYNLLPEYIRKMMLEYNENNTSFQNNILKIPLQTDFSTFIWESHPVYTPTTIEFVQSICEKYNE